MSVIETRSRKLNPEEIRAIMSGKPQVDAREEFEKEKQEIANQKVETKPVVEPKVENPVVNKPAPAADPATKTATASNTKSTEQVKTDGDGDRLAVLEQELRLRDLRMERLEMDNKTWKTRAQTRAGELDFLKNHADRAKSPVEAEASSNDGGLYEEPVRQKSNDPLANRLAELEANEIERAKVSAVQKFTSAHPDFQQDEAFAETLKAKAVDYLSELQSGSPGKVAKAVEMMLNDARLDTLINKEEQAAAEARKKVAAVSDRTRQQKLDSQISDSADSAGNQNVPKTYGSLHEQLMNMPPDQLKALLDKNRSPRR